MPKLYLMSINSCKSIMTRPVNKYTHHNTIAEYLHVHIRVHLHVGIKVYPFITVKSSLTANLRHPRQNTTNECHRPMPCGLAISQNAVLTHDKAFAHSSKRQLRILSKWEYWNTVFMLHLHKSIFNTSANILPHGGLLVNYGKAKCILIMEAKRLHLLYDQDPSRSLRQDAHLKGL